MMWGLRDVGFRSLGEFDGFGSLSAWLPRFGVVFVTNCRPVEPWVVVWLVRGERRRQPVVVIRSAHRGHSLM